MIDAHCHLYAAPDYQEQIAAFQRRGGRRVVCVSEDADSLDKCLRLAAAYPELVAAGGALHPMLIPELSPEAVESFFNRLEEVSEKLQVVGETGLDYKYAVTPEQRHRRLLILERHYRFAVQHQLPLNLHSRRAERPVLEAAERFHRDGGINVQLHWFTSSRKLIRRAAASGLFI